LKIYIKLLLLLLSSINLSYGSLYKIEKIDITSKEISLHFNKEYPKHYIRHFKLFNPTRDIFDLKNSKINHSIYKKYFKIRQLKHKIVRVSILSRKFKSRIYKPLFSHKLYRISLKKYMKIESISDKIIKKIRRKRALAKKRRARHYKKIVKFIKYTPSIKSNEVIVIDAGHGGYDVGAVGGGKREKDLVLMIAKKLAKELKRRGHHIYMTRKSNKFIKLSNRTKIANRKKAILFISIHANSVGKRHRNKLHGIETFFLQKSRDAKSKRVATRENRAVLKGTNRLSKNVIIDSVLSGPKIVESNKLAISVQGNIIRSLRRKYKGIRDGGVRSAPFWVLVGASRPSILIEVGYISHPKERKRLFNSNYQKTLVKGLANGIDKYLYNRKKEIDL